MPSIVKLQSKYLKETAEIADLEFKKLMKYRARK